MIAFILAALADMISTYKVGKIGGVEGLSLLKFIPFKLQWMFQLVAYTVVFSLLWNGPLWLWLVCAALPALGAVNNVIRYKRAT